MPDQSVSSSRLRPLPWPVQVYNTLGRWTIGKGSPVASTESLMAHAARKCRLANFGPKDFEEPLEQLLLSIDNEARLHPFGRFVARKRLSNLLCNRLRAVDWWSRHPEILDEHVQPPIVIAGMQRTGTTLLQRLLALDDRLRSLKSWEALNPAPYHHNDPQKRIKEAATSEKALKYLAQEFFAIHPVEHQSPEEDVLLLDMSLRSTVAEATMHVPSFSKWLERQDQGPAYRFMKDLLKLLQWSGPTGRWVLKSPHHLEWLDTLEEVFPGTMYLQTHRHPREIVPSLCSMIYHGRVLFSEHNDPKTVGTEWINKMERLLERGMQFRQKHSKQFLDIDYRELVSNPIQVMHQVYDFVGLPLEADQIKKMRAFLSVHKQNRYGRHAYQLTDFTTEDIMQRPVFSNYVAQFKL